MSADAPTLAAVILAGGRAQRFGGQDKGLLLLAGEPLVRHVARHLVAHADTLLVSANRNADAYAALGMRVVADTLPGQPGPLAGILAAAQACNQAWLLCVPCDTPFIPHDLIPRLMTAAQHSGHALLRAQDDSGTHYAVMLLHRTLIDDLAAYLAAGGRRVQDWQARHDTLTVTFAGAAHAFMNINTPADLAAAEIIMANEPSTCPPLA